MFIYLGFAMKGNKFTQNLNCKKAANAQNRYIVSLNRENEDNPKDRKVIL